MEGASYVFTSENACRGGDPRTPKAEGKEQCTMENTTNKGGRPSLPSRVRRSHYITIALTEKEYTDIIMQADESGKKPAVMLREMALHGSVKMVPTINKETRAELGKIGGLVKILIEQAREKQIVLNKEYASYLVRLGEVVKQLRSEVMGND